MKTIRWIVSLVDKKAQALVAVLLIGVVGVVLTLKYIHQGAEKDRQQCEKDKLALNQIIQDLQKQRVQDQIRHTEEISIVKDKANDEVKEQLKISQNKVDKLEAIVINTVRAAKNARNTEQSQDRIINKLKDK